MSENKNGLAEKPSFATDRKSTSQFVIGMGKEEFYWTATDPKVPKHTTKNDEAPNS